MVRKLISMGLLGLVSTTFGCAICCNPDDYGYPAYGGRWQRHDMTHGRVGSAFAEAGYDSMGEVSEQRPTPADMLPGNGTRRPSIQYELTNYEEDTVDEAETADHEGQ